MRHRWFPLAALAAGCAPVLSMPPPVPMAEGRRYEFGAAVETTVTLDDGEVSYGCADPLIYAPCTGGGVQGWWRLQATRRLDFGATVFGGTTSLVGSGVTLKYRAVDLETFFLSVDGGLGYVWAAFGFTAGWAASDRLWLTLTPQVAARMHGPLRLGGGFWYTSPAGVAVGGEAIALALPGAGQFQTIPTTSTPATVTFALGVALQPPVAPRESLR